MAKREEFHRRLPEFESFDRIELRVIPRFKTSGLSGDEWRTSVAISFWFKGAVVFEAFARDMSTAIMLIPHFWIQQQEPIPEHVISREKRTCDQPGCSKPHTKQRWILKRVFSPSGDLASRTTAGSVPTTAIAATHRAKTAKRTTRWCHERGPLHHQVSLLQSGARAVPVPGP